MYFAIFRSKILEYFYKSSNKRFHYRLKTISKVTFDESTISQHTYFTALYFEIWLIRWIVSLTELLHTSGNVIQSQIKCDKARWKCSFHYLHFWKSHKCLVLNVALIKCQNMIGIRILHIAKINIYQTPTRACIHNSAFFRKLVRQEAFSSWWTTWTVGKKKQTSKYDVDFWQTHAHNLAYALQMKIRVQFGLRVCKYFVLIRGLLSWVV